MTSVPVAHAMLGGVAAALWLMDKPMAVITQRLYTPTQSCPMLAIPFFIFAFVTGPSRATSRPHGSALSGRDGEFNTPLPL